MSYRDIIYSISLSLSLSVSIQLTKHYYKTFDVPEIFTFSQCSPIWDSTCKYIRYKWTGKYEVTLKL